MKKVYTILIVSVIITIHTQTHCMMSAARVFSRQTAERYCTNPNALNLIDKSTAFVYETGLAESISKLSTLSDYCKTTWRYKQLKKASQKVRDSYSINSKK